MSDWQADESVEIDGISYATDAFGIIHQLNPEPFIYDREYIAVRYDTYDPDKMAAMANLRLDLLMQHVGNQHTDHPRILDWGYGNGAFLKAAMELRGWSAHGYEINGYGVPSGCHESPTPYGISWDVVTMFDVLEHLKDPQEIAELKTRWLMITVPCCHARDMGIEWFGKWKHRRIHEHITNWDAQALEEFLWSLGYKCLYVGSPEDEIRQSDGPWENTLTVVARNMNGHK